MDGRVSPRVPSMSKIRAVIGMAEIIFDSESGQAKIRKMAV